MLSKENLLYSIPETEPVNLIINQETRLEELNDKMEYISNQIAQEYFILNTKVSQVNNILNINYNNKFMNTDFEKQEYIEEYFDNLIYEFERVKELLKKGREIRYFKEKKEKEKDNEIRCARNTLAHYGIKLSE